MIFPLKLIFSKHFSFYSGRLHSGCKGQNHCVILNLTFFFHTICWNSIFKIYSESNNFLKSLLPVLSKPLSSFAWIAANNVPTGLLDFFLASFSVEWYCSDTNQILCLLCSYPPVTYHPIQSKSQSLYNGLQGYTHLGVHCILSHDQLSSSWFHNSPSHLINFLHSSLCLCLSLCLNSLLVDRYMGALGL